MSDKTNELPASYLRDIEQRCGAAKAGPWKSFIEGRDHSSGDSFIQTQVDDIYLTGATLADQDFIAHAREDVPRLLAEIQRLQALLEARRRSA